MYKAILALGALTHQQRCELAQSTEIPEILSVLSQDAEPSIREHVAYNPYTPIAALIQLAGDPCPSVIGAVVDAEHCPAQALQVAADGLNEIDGLYSTEDFADYDSALFCIVTHPSCPAQVLDEVENNQAAPTARGFALGLRAGLQRAKQSDSPA